MSCDLRRPHSCRAPPLITTHLHTICTVFAHTLCLHTQPPLPLPATSSPASYQIPRQTEESVGGARLRASESVPPRRSAAAFPADSCAFLITTVTPASASGPALSSGSREPTTRRFSTLWREAEYFIVIKSPARGNRFSSFIVKIPSSYWCSHKLVL